MKKIYAFGLAAALLVSGCSQSAAVSSPSASAVTADETKTADVIVVGAGGGGMAAAISAVDNGASSVIILEKTTQSGGSLNYTSGSMSGAETVIQEIDGSSKRYRVCGSARRFWRCSSQVVNADWVQTSKGS